MDVLFVLEHYGVESSNYSSKALEYHTFYCDWLRSLFGMLFLGLIKLLRENFYMQLSTIPGVNTAP